MRASKTLFEASFRRSLLGTVSGAVLATFAAVMPQAAQADMMPGSDSHLSIDLSGQWFFAEGDRTIYGAPGFIAPPTVGLKNGSAMGGGLTLTQDEWVYHLGVSFGRTGNALGSFYSEYPGYYGKFSTAAGDVRHHETHAMVDFTIGQDVGLGWLGHDGSLIVSGGLRWANFVGTTIGQFSYYSKYSSSNFGRSLHRTFNGIGPVLSWKGSVPFGDPGCHLSFQWDGSVAVLFGSKSVHGEPFVDRRHNATVPQAGASVGIGWQLPGSGATLSVAYAVNATWGVFDGSYLGAPEMSVDRIDHGPRVSLVFPIH